MASASAMQRETIAAALISVVAVLTLRCRRRAAGDEGRQPFAVTRWFGRLRAVRLGLRLARRIRLLARRIGLFARLVMLLLIGLLEVRLSGAAERLHSVVALVHGIVPRVIAVLAFGPI